VIGVEESLARTYAEQNRIIEVQRLLQDAIESCRSIFGPDHRRVGYLELSLARLLRNQGHLTEALSPGQKVLKRVNISFGCIEAKNSHSISYLEHPETLTALENLAIIRTKLGDMEESIDLFDKILSLRTKFKGPAHPDTIVALENLAWAHFESEKYYAAEQLYRKAVDKNSAVFADGHPRTVSAMLDLGGCLRILNRFPECKDMYNKMLNWLFDRHGEGHEVVAKIYGDLALLHSMEGKLAEAQRYLKDALRIFKKVGSEKAADVMISLCYFALDEHSRAEVQAEETIRYLDTTLGRDHPSFVQAQILLATVLLRNNKYVQTDILIERLRQVIEKYEGKDSTRLLWMERLYAQSMHAQGRIQDTDAFLESCITRRQHVDVRNPELCRLKQFLGNVREEQGKLQEKETILQNLLDDLEQSSFDMQTTTVAEILQELGRTRISLRKHESAEISMKRALDIQKRLWGEENKKTYETERTLAICLVNDDRLQEHMLLQAQILFKYQSSSNLDPENVIGLKRELAATCALAHDFESEVCIRQTIIDESSRSSDPDQQYVRDLQFLALAHQNLGHREETEMRLECLNGMIRELFPGNIRELTWNIHQLALIKEKLGKTNQAESLVQEAVLLGRQNPKEKLSEFLKTLDWLAYLKMKSCKWTEAKAAMTEYLKLREELPEYERPPILDQYKELEFINSQLSGIGSAVVGPLTPSEASGSDLWELSLQT
jgi:tetratricopeptide (TPR) repeat protein